MSAAMSEENLFRNISDAEKTHIPVDTVDKLVSNWLEQINEFSNLREEKEKIQIDSEQEKLLLEKEILHFKEQLQDESIARNQAHLQLQKAESKINTLEDDLQKATERVNTLLRELEHSRINQEETNTRNVTLSGMVESKSILIEELKEQLKSLEDNLQNTQKSKWEALLQADEANTFQIRLQHKEKHHAEEKNLMTRHAELLRCQLEERLDEVRNLRQDHSTALLTVQCELDHSQEKVRFLSEEREALQKTLEEKRLKIQNLLESLNKSRESETKLEETFNQELAAQERLASIYKASCEDQQKRYEELEKGIEELRQLLQDGNEQYGALEKAKKKAEEEAHSVLEEKTLLIEELRDELQKVNTLLEDRTPKDDYMAELSPAAFAARRVLNKGATLSQLYNEYITVSEKLFKTEQENKTLQRYINQVLQEIEEQAPTLKRQKVDYEELIETNNILREESGQFIEEHDRLREVAEEAQRRSKFLGREKECLSQQVKDLGKQVTILLTQVEAARAGVPPPPTSIIENLSNSSSANGLISEHLVAFRNVAELQEQNQKLLVSIRDIADKLDTAGQTDTDEKTKELNIELEAAHSDLKELSENRDRMQVMMDKMKSQRDVYRTLADHKTPITSSSPASAAPVPKDVEQLRKELENARNDSTRIEKMYEEYRKQRDTNAKIEKDEFERMKINFEKTKNDNLGLLAQAEYNEERMGILQSNSDSYQKQLKALEERNTSCQAIIARHESSIETLKKELLHFTKKLSHEEKLNVNLREEKALLKECEASLKAERDNLRHAQPSQNLISMNLQAIKNNLDRRDVEFDMRHTNRVADLAEQCARLKAKIESNVDLKVINMKLNKSEQQLQTARKEAEDAKNELQASQMRLNALKEQLQELQDSSKSPTPSLKRPRLSSTPIQSPSGTPMHPGAAAAAVVTGSVRELQVQLSEERSKVSEERAKVSSFSASLEQSKNNLAYLKDLFSQQEAQLHQSNSVNEKSKQTIESTRKELTEHEKTICELTESVKSCQESERALKQSTDVQLMKLTEDLEERENEMEEVQKKLEDSKKAEAKAHAEMTKHSRMAAETQDKYEREVMLHGADIQVLTSLKEKLTCHSTELENCTVSKLKAEEELSDIRARSEETEAAQKKSIQELTDRVTELEGQNQSLLDQFTQLSDKMALVNTKLSSSSDNGSGDGNVSFSEDDTRSSDQLREVIRYLRRERELAVNKTEVAHAESLRLEAQKKSLESQVQILNRYLTEERLKNQGSAESASRFNELTRKVQTMEALADSNRLLREEKESLKNSCEENVVKVASLLTQIEPMQEKIREMTVMLEDLKTERKSFHDEKELYKKRTQELIEKLNKTRPEDMAKLMQELIACRTQLEEKQVEFLRTKNMHAKLQKIQQMTVLEKQRLEHRVEESKKTLEELKKLQQENTRLKIQLMQNIERMKNLETSMSQTQTANQQEIQKFQEQNNQLLKQAVEYRQKEDDNRREVENLRKEVVKSDTKSKEINSLFEASQDNIEHLERQILQLRKIATKYKKKAEMLPGTVEGSSQNEEVLTASAAKEDDNRVAPGPGPSTKKDDETESGGDAGQVEVVKKDTEKKTGDVDRLHSEIQQKTQELQRINSHYLQYKDTLSKQIAGFEKKLEESQRKHAAYESRINSLEKDNEGLSKKCLLQQRMIENIQKHTSATSKGPGSVITIEKVTDTPPTANIKPMAAPPVTPVAARSQGSVQSGSGPSRSIPTASIRPMAPSPAGQSTSIVVVPPMETHSAGDGAVSSTVTLPQATVTPTPAVPTSTATQPFSFALTATVSPTPVSATIASTGESSQQQQQQPPHSSSGVPPPIQTSLLAHSSTSTVASIVPAAASQVVCMPVPRLQSQQESATGSADSIISQAIALVAPHGDLMEDDPQPGVSDPQSSDPQTRKRKLDEENSDEESKRYCVGVHDSSREEELEEDAGEPSSSSQRQTVHDDDDDDDDEILIVPSDDDDEEDIPISQSKATTMVVQGMDTMEEADDGNSHGLVIMSVQGGREAEMQFSSLNSEAQQSHTSEVDDPEGTGTSDQTSLSFQPPTRPGRGSLVLTQEQPTSSRQSLTSYQQLSQVEEPADERIVPSTPTLIVPRQDFSSADEVSSPQVPSQDFIFRVGSEAATLSHVGSAQITEGGIIDVTRMDFAQLDDGTHKSTPTTPVRRSPAVEFSSEGNISSSAGEGSTAEVEVCPEPGPSSGCADGSVPKQQEPDSGLPAVDRREKADTLKGGPSGHHVEDIEEDDSDNVEILPAPRDPVTEAPAGSPLRTTRSAAANQSQSTGGAQVRRPTPITFDNPRSQREGAALSRGRGVEQARRSHSVARRSRAHKGPY